MPPTRPARTRPASQLHPSELRESPRTWLTRHTQGKTGVEHSFVPRAAPAPDEHFLQKGVTALPTFPRVLGTLTAAYGAAVLVRPRLLAEPCGLTDDNGALSDSVTVLSRAIGFRDVFSGVAVATAPAGPPLRWAVAIRALSDVADATVFGLCLPDRRARGKAAAVAGLWGALCAASAAAADSHHGRASQRQLGD